MLAAALGVLALAIFTPQLLGLKPWGGQVKAAQSVAEAQPMGHLQARDGARKRSRKRGRILSRPTTGEPKNGTGSTTRKDLVSRLLCKPLASLQIAKRGSLAIAADAEGHFTLYALPSSKTGRPRAESYQILDDCTKTGEYANFASLEVATRETGPAGLPIKWLLDKASGPHVRQETKAAGGGLLTEYQFAHSVSLKQKLRLERSGTLEISYTVTNSSGHAQKVAIRSLLTPVKANQNQSVLFTTKGGTPREVTKDTVLGLSEKPTAVAVPRPGAASDSSALWSPGGTGPAPSAVALGGFYRLYDAPFDYHPRADIPLSPNAAMAVYWKPVTLAPGSSVTFTETYKPVPARSLASATAAK